MFRSLNKKPSCGPRIAFLFNSLDKHPGEAEFDAFRQQTGGNIVAELLQDMLNWLAGYLGVSIVLLVVTHRLLGGAKRKADTTGSAGSRASQATVR